MLVYGTALLPNSLFQNKSIDATFGETLDAAIVLLEGDIYTPAALEQIRQLTNEIEDIEGVVEVLSVANGARFEDDNGFLNIEDLLPEIGEISQEDVANMRNFLSSSYLYKDGLLVSKEGDFTTIIIELPEDVDASSFNKSLQEILDAHWEGMAYIAGKPAIKATMQTAMQRDLPLLTGLAALLILVFLFLNFRTLQGALLPLLTVLIGLIWSLGGLGYLGHDMTTLSVIAPVAIMAVGSSFSLHLLLQRNVMEYNS